MRNSCVVLVAGFATLQLVGCASMHRIDIAHDPYPEAQAEVWEVVQIQTNDALAGNAEGIRAAHLYSDKFTKFPGGKYERIGFTECVDAEIEGFSSLKNLKLHAGGVKIDVFGDVAILTEYFQLSHTENGKPETIDARVTLVFLKTDDGWKIVHEHVSGKDCYDQ